MKEKQKHLDAFEHYRNLGEERTLEKLRQWYAKNTPGKTPSIDTIKRWSTNFNWQERIVLRDREVTQHARKKVMSEEADIKIMAYRRTKELGGVLASALNTAFYKDPEEGNKRKIRPDLRISSARELKEVAIGALKCETEALRIITPEEEEITHKGTIELTSPHLDPKIAKAAAKLITKMQSEQSMVEKEKE